MVPTGNAAGSHPPDGGVLPSFSTFEGPTGGGAQSRSPGGVTASLPGGPSPARSKGSPRRGGPAGRLGGRAGIAEARAPLRDADPQPPPTRAAPSMTRSWARGPPSSPRRRSAGAATPRKSIRVTSNSRLSAGRGSPVGPRSASMVERSISALSISDEPSNGGDHAEDEDQDAHPVERDPERHLVAKVPARVVHSLGDLQDEDEDGEGQQNERHLSGRPRLSSTPERLPLALMHERHRIARHDRVHTTSSAPDGGR
jgi:hypothetical protein